MQIIVSDSSALIDLRKGGILELFLKLPFEFVIPDALIESELLSFTKKELAALRKHMKVATLDGTGVKQARAIVAETPALSLLDGFALVVATQHPGAILLTGDKRMRQRAESTRIECHGVLWIVEELLKLPNPEIKMLRVALHTWSEDPYVRLPASEIERLIESTKN